MRSAQFWHSSENRTIPIPWLISSRRSTGSGKAQYSKLPHDVSHPRYILSDKMMLIECYVRRCGCCISWKLVRYGVRSGVLIFTPSGQSLKSKFHDNRSSRVRTAHDLPTNWPRHPASTLENGTGTYCPSPVALSESRCNMYGIQLIIMLLT